MRRDIKMKEIKESTYKGTRILVGDEKRTLTNNMVNYLKNIGYTEIQIPIIQFQEIFSNKVGEENNKMMFNFKDRGNRDICLAPEYTAVIQKLSKTYYKQNKDLKLFYVQECFRGETPQNGRYREFTQFGVEIINPTKDYLDDLSEIAIDLIQLCGIDCDLIELNKNAIRGLDYYIGGKGFEISYSKLGSSKQICGGGEYDGGVGFAIGLDRILNVV